VILGAGAFGKENVDRCLKYGAKSIKWICRNFYMSYSDYSSYKHVRCSLNPNILDDNFSVAEWRKCTEKMHRLNKAIPETSIYWNTKNSL
jgi:hypothetical protein